MRAIQRTQDLQNRFRRSKVKRAKAFSGQTNTQTDIPVTTRLSPHVKDKLASRVR